MASFRGMRAREEDLPALIAQERVANELAALRRVLAAVGLLLYVVDLPDADVAEMEDAAARLLAEEVRGGG